MCAVIMGTAEGQRLPSYEQAGVETKKWATACGMKNIFNLCPVQHTNTPTTMASAAKTFITAQSWNGTWFYYNVTRDTWECADDVIVCHEHYAGADQMKSAMMCAVREKFAAANIAKATGNTL